MKKLCSATPLACSLMASVAAVSSCSDKNDDQQKYNIVYIMTDDHTAQMMSC